MSADWEALWYGAGPPALAQRLALPGLALAELGYRSAVRVRNALYDRGRLKAHSIEGVRVISVGNLAVGGSGKTPVVIHLANRLAGSGERVAVLSRGYGRRNRQARRVSAEDSAEAVGDEPLLIARRCPQVAVWVGADRVAIARRARDDGAAVLLLDDGMQHRRLERDVEIAVVDGRALFGNGRLLPRGPLREPTSALARADLIWLVEGEQRPQAPLGRPVVRARHFLSAVRRADGSEQALGALAGRAVFPVLGIARPSRVRASLERAGARVVGEALFPDHHFFTAQELARVRDQANALGAELVTTEKDAVRLPKSFLAWSLKLEVEILEGAEGLAAIL